MDMNTIEAVVPTTDPAEWRDGDAWLAGGTVLFSYGSTVLKRLLDLGQAGWPAVTVSGAGIELAATCTVAELYALPGSDEVAGREWPGLDLFRPCCDSFVASFKVWNMSTVGGNLCTSLPAGPMISLCAGLDATAIILGPAAAAAPSRWPRSSPETGKTAWHPGNSCAASTCRRRHCLRRWPSGGSRSATSAGPESC
ncbi:molybdopterin dehydrogenase FAD-binding [Arthrobacter sp. Hiyo4]|nr:molybdopterin dehydrogenase FAD-binding [Arthrobacter sp. Hiyo4]